MIGWGVVWFGAVSQGADTNAVAHARALVERVTALRDGCTNDPGRATCVADKLVQLEAVVALIQESTEQLRVLAGDGESELAAAERGRLRAAVTRAEQLATAAGQCRSEPVLRGRRPVAPITATAGSGTAATVTVPAIPRVPSRPRHEDDCIRQGETARWLARALEMDVDGQGVTGVTKALSAVGIEPLGGWRTADCTTRDDFCVAVARALALPVADQEEPASYERALRDAGLPVDSVLPPGAKERLVPLLATEVRLFLTQGLAAPVRRTFGAPGR